MDWTGHINVGLVDVAILDIVVVSDTGSLDIHLTVVVLDSQSHLILVSEVEQLGLEVRFFLFELKDAIIEGLDLQFVAGDEFG